MCKYVANMINSSTKNVFLVQMATDAFNCLVKSMKWTTGDIILLPNAAYSIRKTLMLLQ